MKKTIIIVSALLLLGGGCVANVSSTPSAPAPKDTNDRAAAPAPTPPPTPPTVPSPSAATNGKDCGTDAACFYTATAVGTAATVVVPKLVQLEGDIYLVYHARLVLAQGEGGWTYKEDILSATHLAQVDRPMLLQAGVSAADADKTIAANTREGMAATGVSADVMSAIWAPNFLADIAAKSSGISCAQVTRTELLKVLAKWSQQEVSFPGRTEAGATLHGDYDFGQCVAVKK